MITKHDIRRALFGTCTVTPSRDFVVTPHEVTLSVQRRCRCWPSLVTSSRRVATFLFEELIPWKRISAHGLLDLEYLFQCSRKGDVESTQIKICVKDFYEDRRVFHLGLEEFLTQLLHGGRQEWFFLDISEGKVTLWLANQDEQQQDSQQSSEGETEDKDSLQDDETEKTEQQNTQQSSEGETEDKDSLQDDETDKTEQRNTQQSSEGETEDKDSLQDDETEKSQNNDDEELDSGWETIDDDDDDDQDNTTSVVNMTQEVTSKTEMTSRCTFSKGVRVVLRYGSGVLLVAEFVALILRILRW